MRILLLAIGIFLLLPSYSTAQIKLSLPQCLEIGVENNLGARQGINSVTSAEINLIQRKFEFLPNLNFGLTATRNIGQTIDNFTQQIASSPTTAVPGISSSFTLFNGFSRWNNLKSAKYDIEAAQYTLEDLKNDIRLNVATAYFATIFAKESEKIVQERVDLVAKQLERSQRLQKAGQATEGDVLLVEAQLATERTALVNATNTYESSLLNLILALNLDPTDTYELAMPDLEGVFVEPGMPNVESVLTSARENHPGLQAAQARIRTSELQNKIAQAAYYPTLTLSYNMGSFYSSNAREATGFEIDSLEGIRIVYGPTIPLFTQFGNNFGQGVSLSLNVPIFNRYQARNQFFQSRLNIDNTVLNYEIERNGVYQEVMRAYQDAKAAKARLDASETQLIATQKSLAYAEQRSDAGLLNSYEFLEILNNNTNAANELLQARYDYVLKRKVLELYQGRKLEFE